MRLLGVRVTEGLNLAEQLPYFPQRGLRSGLALRWEYSVSGEDHERAEYCHQVARSL